MKFNKRILLLLAVIVVASVALSLISQPQPTASFAVLNEESIDLDRALNVINILSSPEYDGRLPSTEGNAKTVSYIADQFQEIGLTSPPSISDYRQPFEQEIVLINQPPALAIRDSSGAVTQQFNHLTEFLARPTWPDTRINGSLIASMHYVRTVAELEQKAQQFNGYALLVGDDAVQQYQNQRYGLYSLVQKILELNPEVKAIIFNNDIRRDGFFPISNSLHVKITEGGSFDENGPMILYTTQDTFASLRKSLAAGGFVEIAMDYNLTTCTSENVLGVIEGTDPELKDNFIIIGAHLDHIGNNKDGSYNPGALDNASGIAALLEVARSIKASGVEPQKSVLFIAFNGEEEYLAGSRYYVTDPVYPLTNAKMINLDVIGSQNASHLSLSISGSVSSGLRNEMRKHARALGIKAKNSNIGASDHIPFTQARVPSVFLIHFEHVARIHTVNDTAEKTIDMQKFKEAVELVVHYLDKNLFGE